MDYEFDAGEIVTCVNRTKRVLEIRFNGRIVAKLVPGSNAINEAYARFAYRQHPVPGTYHPGMEHQHDSLVGVEAWGQPVDDLDEAAFAHIKESLDRSLLPPEKQNIEQVKVGWGVDHSAAGEKPGEQNVGALAGRNPLSDNSTFGIQPQY